MAWIHLWLTPRQLSVIGLRMIKELAVTRYYAWFLLCLGIHWIPETSASLPNTKGSIRSSDWLYPFCFFLLSPNNLALFNQRKLYFQTRVSIQTDLFHLRLWHQGLSCHTWVFLYLTAEILEIVELALKTDQVGLILKDTLKLMLWALNLPWKETYQEHTLLLVFFSSLREYK